MNVESIKMAAEISVSGRVLDRRGGGTHKVTVILIDSRGFSRRMVSNCSGYYKFDKVPAGENFIVSVADGSHSFNPDVRSLNVIGDLDDVNFITESCSE